MKKIITILAVATLFSCTTNEDSNGVDPIDPIEDEIRYVNLNDTIPVQNNYWLSVRQTQLYNVFANGQGRTLEVNSNNSNSTFFTSDNRYRVYSIVSQYKVSKTRKKYVNNILTETNVIGEQYVMNAAAFNNNHVLKFDVISRIYTDANGVEWNVN
jgi:hypothetical protein